MARHIVVPDCQIRPGDDLEFIDAIAQYIVDKKPDVLVLIGDWADMKSLSTYDIGTTDHENQTYRADILAANDALQRLMAPIQAEMERIARRHLKKWNLRKIVTLGNHEDRITRWIKKNGELRKLMSLDDLFFKQWGFEVYPFLQPVTVDGIAYCHYFTSGVMGKPITTARALLTKLHMSCFAGHQQGRDIAYGKRADGSTITGIICGSCYEHDEDYLGPQGNRHFRGLYVLHEVEGGAFDEMPVSLRFLRERHEKRARPSLGRVLAGSEPEPEPFA